MREIEEALVDILLSETDITNVVGDRVYPYERAQGSLVPAITVFRVSGGALYSDDGNIGLENPRYEVDSWGTTYGQAKELARAVANTLSFFVGVVTISTSPSSNVEFQLIELDNERDEKIQGTNEAEYHYKIAQDYSLWVIT